MAELSHRLNAGALKPRFIKDGMIATEAWPWHGNNDFSNGEHGLLKCLLENRVNSALLTSFHRQTIMYTIKLRHLAACVAIFAMLPAHAQPAPSDAPPRLERLEEGQAPQTEPVPSQPRDKIIERRAPGGQVNEIEVSKGGSTYILKPNEQAGNATPGELQSNRNRAAQWQVFGFDLKRDQEKNAAQRDAGTPPPEPATPRK
jgi:hypothetical protein